MNAEPIFRVKFSTRGRVTIPVVVRRKFGIKHGTRLPIEITPSGEILLRTRAAKR